MIGRTFALHEFPSLIEAIFSSEDEDKAIRRLPVNGAQMLIEVLDEARLLVAVSLLVETDVNTFCQLGTEYSRSFVPGPKEMS